MPWNSWDGEHSFPEEGWTQRRGQARATRRPGAGLTAAAPPPGGRGWAAPTAQRLTQGPLPPPPGRVQRQPGRESVISKQPL